MNLGLILLIFVFNFAAGADRECERQLLSANNQGAAKFIFGRATNINLSLLKNFELIPDEVRERFQGEIRALDSFTRAESHAMALAYVQDPREKNRLRLFRALRVLVPMASRHLLAKLHSADALEDYFQTGYLTLWEDLPDLMQIPPSKLTQISYWDRVANSLRRRIFAAMRTQFKIFYSLTPARMANGTALTFEEEILLFGDSESARAEIAQNYQRSTDAAEREWRIQNDSVARNEEKQEAISVTDTAEDLEERLAAADLKRAFAKVFGQLTLRQERVIRELFFQERMLDEIGDSLGVGRHRIAFLLKQAVQRMKQPTNLRTLSPFSSAPPRPRL